MTITVRQALSLLLLAISVASLGARAPLAVWREAYFILVMSTLTLVTRSVAWRMATYALALGIGIAVPLMIGIGWLLERGGLDLAESEFGSWAIVPITEEVIKLAMVFLAAWTFKRRSSLTFNPSDWLLVGCAVGAGFAMVENAELVQKSPSVLRDMARQYGPSWLVPGAWGSSGYVGHAAATGLAAAGIGVATAMRRAAGATRVPHGVIAGVLVAPFAWVTLEHMLANLHANTGSSAALVMGNGRLTPWLFLAAVGFLLTRDYVNGKRALTHSLILRTRRAVIRETLVGTVVPKRRSMRHRLAAAASEQRLVNAVAWSALEQLADDRRRDDPGSR